MPDFIYRWIEILIYYLNLFLGNIEFVQFLKSIIKERERMFYVFPVLIFLGLIVVILTIIFAKFFSIDRNIERKKGKK